MFWREWWGHHHILVAVSLSCPLVLHTCWCYDLFQDFSFNQDSAQMPSWASSSPKSESQNQVKWGSVTGTHLQKHIFLWIEVCEKIYVWFNMLYIFVEQETMAITISSLYFLLSLLSIFCSLLLLSIHVCTWVCTCV